MTGTRRLVTSVLPALVAGLLLAVPGMAATNVHKVKHAVAPRPPLHGVPNRRASRHYVRRGFTHRVPNRRAKPLSRRKSPFRSSKHPMSRARRHPIRQARLYRRPVYRRPVYRRYYRRPVRYRYGPSSDRINQIQRALARSGFYQGDPTGRWDENTVQAMKNFQQAQGLPPTGKIDAPSLQMLGLGSAVAGLAPPRPLIGSDPADSSSKESKAGSGVTR